MTALNLSLKSPSLIGQPSSEATQREVVLGFPAVVQFWPGPKSFSSQGLCPDLQTVREALICIVFLGGLGSALSTARVPQPQGTLSRGVYCAFCCLARILNQLNQPGKANMTLTMGYNGNSGP